MPCWPILIRTGSWKIIVGFWGLMGVHCVALDGRVLWSNADASHVHSLVLGGSGADPRTIWVAGAERSRWCPWTVRVGPARG